MRATLTIFLVLLIAFSVFAVEEMPAVKLQKVNVGPTQYNRIMEDFKSGKLSVDEAMLYLAYSATNSQELPAEYRDLPTTRSATLPVMEVFNYRDEISPQAEGEIMECLDRPDLSSYFETAHFRIHYSGSEPTSLGSYFEEAYTFCHTTLGYSIPPSDGTVGGNSKYDIYLYSTSPGVGGYCSPEATVPSTSIPNDATSYIVISSSLSGEDTKRVVCIHEYFHATQFAYDASDAERWYYEHSSVWIEKERYPTIDDPLYYLPSYFNDPSVSLRTYDGDHEYASYVFNEFIDRRFGRNTIKTTWENTTSSNMLNALNSALADAGSSRNAALAEFWIWNYFTGTRAEPLGRYGEAADYPTMHVERTVSTAGYPATGSTSHAPDNWGNNYIVFSVPAGASGPFSVVFDGQDGAIWSAQLVLPGTEVYNVEPITLNAYGYGTITLDEADYTGLSEIILVAGVLSNSGEGLNFDWSAAFETIDPTYEPPTNLVATSGFSGEVPLTWDPPSGGGLGGLEELSVDDGTAYGTGSFTEEVYECVGFTIAVDCTLKQVKLFGTSDGSMAFHVWPDASGAPDVATDLVTPFNANVSSGSWATTDLAGDGLYLPAGDYWVGAHRTGDEPSVYLDSGTLTDQSLVYVVSSGGMGTYGNNFMIRLNVHSMGGGGSLTSYNVKRASSMAGPFAYIAEVYMEGYTDETVTDEETYYYTVSANYGGTESVNSNVAMAVPSAISADIETLYADSGSPDGYITWGTGVKLGKQFEIDGPVQILDVSYLIANEGSYISTIHQMQGDRPLSTPYVEIPWYSFAPSGSAAWSPIPLEEVGVYASNDFIVAYEPLHDSLYLAHEEADDALSWIRSGAWVLNDSTEYSIRAVIRHLDTTETYSLSGTVLLGAGTGGSEEPSDLSGSVVRIIGSDLACTTSTDGSYLIEDIAPGLQQVKVSHGAYQSIFMDIGFDGDQYQDFALLPASTPLNPVPQIVTVSYLDSEVPVYWGLPLGRPGTYASLTYQDGTPHWYTRLDTDDMQVQHFTVDYPCSLQSFQAILYDSTGTYRDVLIQVWADDGFGFPDLTHPLSEEITLEDPEGYPTIDGVDLTDQFIYLDAGQDFHISVKQTSNHTFVVRDSTWEFDPPTRSKIFIDESSAWNDSLSDFFVWANIKYTEYARTDPMFDRDEEESLGPEPSRNFIRSSDTRIAGVFRRYDSEAPFFSPMEEEEEMVGFEGYNIYRSDEEEGDFDLMASVSDTNSWTDTTVTNDEKYWYGIEAVYSHGIAETPYVACATPRAWNDSARVLLVDDDASNFIGATDVYDYYAEALNGAGVEYNVTEVCCTLGTAGPSADAMAGFDAVFWFTGAGYRDGWTVTAEDEIEIASYVDDGGSFALFAHDYLYDMYEEVITFDEGDFPYDVFGLRGVTQDNWSITGTSHFTVQGNPDAFTRDMSFATTNEAYNPGNIDVDYFLGYTDDCFQAFGIGSGTESACALAHSEHNAFFSSVGIEALVDGDSPSTTAEFVDALLRYYFEFYGPMGDTAVTFSKAIVPGWNLVSMPVQPLLSSVDDVFPGRIGSAYTFNPGSRSYDADSIIVPGKGYFVLFAAETTLTWRGMPVDSFRLPVYAGWNQIGALYNPDSLDMMYIDFDGTSDIIAQLYKYDPTGRSYTMTPWMVRGVGYWALIDGDDFITVPGAEAFRGVAPRKVNSFSIGSTNFGISDGKAIIDAIPPAVPGGEDNTPIYLNYNGIKAKELYTTESVTYELVVNNEAEYSVECPEGYNLKIDNEIVNNKVYLAKGTHNVNITSLPEEYSIVSASPNPFNPSTTIEFEIPEKSGVELSVYDVEGKLVETLVNNTLEAGIHSTIWDASKTASGVYYIKMNTAESSETMRVLYMK